MLLVRKGKKMVHKMNLINWKLWRKFLMNITVYLGANEGNDPELKCAVRELGT